MERIQQSLLGTRESFAKCTRATRCLIIAVGTLVLAWGAYQLSRPRQTEFCPLFLGQAATLEVADLERMEIALGKSGLTEFELRNGRVWVPSEHKAEYLLALDREDALPEQWRTQSEPEAGLFASRADREREERERKKKQVEQMVGRLPFVEKAWLEIGQTAPRNVFEAPLQTAVIGIKPAGNQSLSADQIRTVRQVVANAVGGVVAESVVVADYHPGRAYGGTNPSGEAAPNLRMAERQSHYEKLIARALLGFEGVEVHVDYELPPPAVEARRPPITRFAARSQFPAPGPARRDAEILYGANGVASIENVKPPAQLPSADLPPPPANTGDEWAGEQVLVTVKVPRDLILASGPKDPRQPPGSVDGLAALQREIVNRVTPLLPIASFDRSNQHPIRVEPLPGDAETAAVSTWSQWEERARQYGWPAAILGIGLCWIAGIAIPGWVRSSRANPESNADEPTPLSSDDLSRYREAEGKLSQLVDADPEAAAQVIRSWIRDAA